MGLAVSVDSTVLFADALSALGCDRRDDVYWAGLATLVHRPEDFDAYDRAFRAWWERVGPLHSVSTTVRELEVAFDADGDEPDESGNETLEQSTPNVQVRYSRQEVLRQRDFADYTSEEFRSPAGSWPTCGWPVPLRVAPFTCRPARRGRPICDGPSGEAADRR
jgi:uncharacterized protein with von Willebrand factor type A (vWA) domain